jgi:serine/threonine-protein kinase
VAQATYSSERKVLVKGATGGRYLSSGHLVFVRQGTLFAEPFDVDRLATKGNASPVMEGIFDNRVQGSVNASGFAVSSQFSVSRDGVLAYMPATAPSLERTLTWVDRQGRETAIAAPPRPYAYPRLSPDGSQIAVDVRDQENDIHIWDVSRQTMRRLTFDPKPDAVPVWTPDGQRIVYSAVGQGLVSRAADGSGSVEVLTRQGEFLHSPSSFSPDGQTLIFGQSKGDYDIHRVSLNGHETAPLIQTSANELNAVVSPDGKWIAYESNESGVTKIYVRPFPAVQDGRWEIASENATRPAWVSNREISYMMPGGTMMVVGVNATKGFQLDNPTKLFSGPYLMTLSARTYDVARDGQRFLMVKIASPQATEAPSIIVVENWFEELKRRVPAE